ncbi:MAG: glycosyltransferase [Hyphomicrobium sp.]
MRAVAPPTPRLGDVGVVAIGRNEGARLEQCLHSVVGQADLIVYVDSGSTDGSVALAARLGARVVSLDLDTPFTAARARNAGLAVVNRDAPYIHYIQFVDGDCEVEKGWLEIARSALVGRPDVAAVYGRRRERFLEATIYNRMCDSEWNVPPGEVKFCGGDVMMRRDAVSEVGGYRGSLIAGEEPELCIRLRQRGWKILNVAHPMTIHDAAITRFSQWWRRSMRAGYAFAEGRHLHGQPPTRHWVAESRRIMLWGVALPAAIVIAAYWSGPWAGVPALIYPLQVWRLHMRDASRTGLPIAASVLRVVGNFPEAAGQLKFQLDQLLSRKAKIIEYK